MKKYVKPELVCESFEMSQQIAACQYDLVEGSSTDNNCKFYGSGEFGEMTIFTNQCGAYSEAVDVSNYGYCYHNSITSPIGIFNS